MSQMELPLVIFTVLSQTAVGLVAVSAIRQHAAEGPAGSVRPEWMTAALLLIAGLVASLFHLGHPLGAPLAIKHLGRAWLSREALGIGVFTALVIIGFLTARGRVNAGLSFAAAAVGLIALFFTGMTYSPPGFPALNNVLPFVFFLLTAAMVGAGFAAYFTPAEKMPMITRILAVSLIVGLVVYLVVPFLWLSGGTVMRQTGLNYISSPLYWARIIVGLVVPLMAIWRMRTVAAWVPVFVLAGEIMGRIAFFLLAVHASANMGGIY